MTDVDHVVDVVADTDDDDDDFVPPVPVRVDDRTRRLDTCPACSKPIAKHGVMELLECAETADEQAEAARHWYMVQTRVGHEETVKKALEVRLADASIEVVENKLVPGYLLVRCDLDHTNWQMIKRTNDVKGFMNPSGGRPAALAEDEVAKFLPQAGPAPPGFETFVGGGSPKRSNGAGLSAETVATASESLPPRPSPKVVVPNGELDYEELAAAMRVVLEKERDEIIRRGGPIEKQNIELKEKLADAFDQISLLRRRLQSTAEARNMLQGQVDELVKTNRKLKNELKGRKESGNHTHLNEISDILAVVRKAPGWTVEMGGNGHYQIKKNGVFITDAAGSGGSTRVNQATRVKLRKAGLEV